MEQPDKDQTESAELDAAVRAANADPDAPLIDSISETPAQTASAEAVAPAAEDPTTETIAADANGEASDPAAVTAAPDTEQPDSEQHDTGQHDTGQQDTGEPSAGRSRRPRRERPPRERRPQEPLVTISVGEYVQAVMPEVRAESHAYGALLQQLPSLLHTSGLGQTLAYLKTLETPVSASLNSHVSGWVLRNRKSAGPDLLEALVRRTNGFHEEALDETFVWLAEMTRQLEMGGA